MGFSTNEKVGIVTYKLKDLVHACYVKWRDNSPLRGNVVIWEIFKVDFLNRFFHREMREKKVVEFISLLQGGRSVHDYTLEFIMFSK